MAYTGTRTDPRWASFGGCAIGFALVLGAVLGALVALA